MKVDKKLIEDIKNKLNLIEHKDFNLFENITNSLFQVNKDLNSIVSFFENKNLSTENIRKYTALYRLQVGGGSRVLDGYINLDIFKPADIVWDVRSGIPFEDKRFTEVFCEHFFEHLDFPRSSLFFLEEVFRVLKKGGSLKIVVPDCGTPLVKYSIKDDRYFEKIKDICYSSRLSSMEISSNIDIINYLFRDQFENPNYTIHWWAYDFENLSRMLRKVGFNVVKSWEFDSIICNPKRKDYSLYIIATK